jgi:hypothetical protein
VRLHAAALAIVTVKEIVHLRPEQFRMRPQGGSLKRRMPHRDVRRAAGAIQIDRDYSCSYLDMPASLLRLNPSLSGVIGFLALCISAFVTG